MIDYADAYVDAAPSRISKINLKIRGNNRIAKVDVVLELEDSEEKAYSVKLNDDGSLPDNLLSDSQLPKLPATMRRIRITVTAQLKSNG